MRTLALVIALASTAPLAGCASSGRAVIVADLGPPPAAREEYVVYRPGYVWVHGNWQRVEGRWQWRHGYYERERPGYVWTDGRWERRGRHHVWVDGGWRARTTITVRGHRRL